MRAGTPSHTYSERYGARSPWLVARWRVVLYLIWRAVFAALRPFLFLCLCLGALLFAYRGAAHLPIEALVPAPTLAERFDAFMQREARAQSGGDVLSLWRAELDQSLALSRSGPPDLLRARSVAASLPAVMGRERLALYLMRGDRRPELMQADLAAMPVWRRRQIIEGVLAGRLETASSQPDAVWLIEASDTVRRRYDRAQALYGPSLQAAEAWFHAPDGLAINLSAFPGVTTPEHDDPSLVLPDARELIVQGCALAQAQGQRVPACSRAGLSLPSADPVRAALALSLYDPALEPASVRLALAARAAGRLEGRWLEELMLGPPAREREMRLLTALMPVLAQADQYYARPETCAVACQAAMAEFSAAAGLDVNQRRDWFDAYDALRRQEGALVALRISDVMSVQGDVHKLVRLSAVSEGGLLAAHALLGRALMWIETPELFSSRDYDRAEFVFAAALAGLALALLGIVLISGHFRRSGGPPGAFERLDGEVSRLILGRNL
jgi:hypothetical protein